MSAQQFSTCILQPYDADTGTVATSTESITTTTTVVRRNPKGQWSTTALYTDSLGRARVQVPLQLVFASPAILNAFLVENCIQPIPSEVKVDGSDVGGDPVVPPLPPPQPSVTTTTTTTTTSIPQQQQQQQPLLKKSIALEAKVNLTFGTGHAITSRVERVTILSTQQLHTATTEHTHHNTSSILFHTEIIVQVSNVDDDDDTAVTTTTTTAAAAVGNGARSRRMDSTTATETAKSMVKLNLEITATFTEMKLPSSSSDNDDATLSTIIDTTSTTTTATMLRKQELASLFSRGGRYGSQRHHPAAAVVVVTRSLSPVSLHVALQHAMTIQVRSLPGPIMGQTYIAIQMAHSNSHVHPVTITNIALHPGVSTIITTRLPLNVPPENANTTATTAAAAIPMDTLDMNHSVQWGLVTDNVQQQQQQLPLVIQPHEAYSMILSVVAQNNNNNDTSCWWGSYYSCPLTVSARIMDPNNSLSRTMVVDGGGGTDTGTAIVLTTTHVDYTTGCTVTEPSDAFRIQMTLVPAKERIIVDDDQHHPTTTTTTTTVDDTSISYTVGALMTVQLDISNLSSEARHLMLQLDHCSRTSTSTTTGRWTVVSERDDGYQFRVKSGPTDYDDEERNVVAIDSALVIGELKGFSSTQAKLRMVPLQKGTLTIPHFKLVDYRTGKRYQCIHQLQAVVD
jgi:hypothetical protein